MEIILFVKNYFVENYFEKLKDDQKLRFIKSPLALGLGPSPHITPTFILHTHTHKHTHTQFYEVVFEKNLFDKVIFDVQNPPLLKTFLFRINAKTKTNKYLGLVRHIYKLFNTA